MKVFDALESEVRSYCRSFPTVFARAHGSTLVDESGREFLDFFSGAGTLNYGHNNPRFQGALLRYIEQGGIAHALDMSTVAKRNLLLRFNEVILQPRGLEYKIQFPGPTGTNAIEAALKLARKVTGRRTVVYFLNGYHGMTLGSLAVTGNRNKRAAAGVPLHYTTAMPYDGDLGPGQDSLEHFRLYLENSGSGMELPAAVIVETVQAEGGVKVASFDWLQRLAQMLREWGILLIVDDIQVGCGRTGPFFSFEPAGIYPDIVVLSKSISGFGLPMSLVLIRPELDVWRPGEHNGTFRGNNLAFVTAVEALSYWENDALSRAVEEKSAHLRSRLEAMVQNHPGVGGRWRGRGLIQGVVFADPELAGRISRQAFEHGLVVETAGPKDEVLKLLPPLVIESEELESGLEIIEESLAEVSASVAVS